MVQMTLKPLNTFSPSLNHHNTTKERPMIEKAMRHSNAFSTLLHDVGKDFLERNNIHYLMIRRTYKDGRFAWICNLDQFKEDFFEKKVFIPKGADDENTQNLLPTEDQMCFWEESLPLLTLKYAKQQFNLHDGMGIFVPNEEKVYVDYIAMAIQGNPTDRPFSFYAGILPQIENLKRDLYKEEKLWESCNEKNDLFSSTISTEPPICDRLALVKDHGQLVLQNPFCTFSLSLEEGLCIFWAKQKKTLPEISRLVALPKKNIKMLIYNLGPVNTI